MGRWTPQMVMPKVKSFIAAGRLEYRPASRSWYYDKQPLSEREVARRIAFTIGAPVCQAELCVSVCGMDLVEASRTSLQNWVLDLENQDRRGGKLGQPWPKGDKDGYTVLKDFIRIIQHPDTDEELSWCNIWAMRQWFWQTKCNMMGKPVTWHVTPIFWSKENGTGKTFNLKRMLKPVEGYTRHMAVDELGERFSKKLLSQTHVVVFDEFAKASAADVATFKSMITGRPLEGREMYGEGGFYAENRLSCIATSNLTPPHNFEDTSGARRFWSIHCHEFPAGSEESNKRMMQMDQIDWERMWECVSINEPSIHKATPDRYLKRMALERSQKMRARDSFELFTEECLEKGVPEDRVPFKALIDAYRQWCAHSNHHRLKAGQQRTAERLEDLGHRCVNTSNKRFLCGYKLTLEA